MKRMVLLGIVLSLGLMVSGLSAITIDEVIDKNIKAKGGQDKIDSIETIRFKGISRMAGMEVPVTVLIKKPFKYLSESVVQGIKMKQVFDGDTAWMQMGDQPPMVMPDAQARLMKENSNLEGMLLNAKKKGYSVELVGTDVVDSVSAYHLKILQPKKHISHVYIDASTFLEFHVITQGEIEGSEFSTSMHLDNYKDVDGVKMAHSITMEMEQLGTITLDYDTIEFNVEIDDSVFAYPGVSATQDKPETESESE